MKKRSVATAIGGCLFLGVHTSVAATNDLEQADASRIVVTATRNPADLRDIPSNPTVITAQEITAGRYRSVTEALSKQAGLHFSNFADNPANAQVSIRGFGENSHGRVLVLLNGRKLNQMDQQPINWAQVPIQAVDRIEVVRGPSSVLYGNHAVGGVINIITRDGTEEPQTTVTASAGSHAAADLTAVTSGNLDGLGYVATLGHQSGDGYRDRSRFKTHSGSLRLSGPINDQLSAYAEASIVREKHQLPGSLDLDQVREDRRQAGRPADEARSTHLQFQTGIEAHLSDVTVFNLDAGISRKEIEVDPVSWFTFFDYKLMGYSLSPKLTFLTPVAGMENELIIGTDLSRETLKMDRFNDLGRTDRAADARITKDVAGAYIADTLSLTDQLRLSAGARIERNRVGVRHQSAVPWATPYQERIRRTEEAWETALTWLPTDQLKLFAGVSRTYRYPFVDEQAMYQGYGGDAFNPDLKPETGMNYEAGIELIPFENTTVQATLFRLDMKDEIAWVGEFDGRNENLDETTRYGIELAAGYRHDLFAIHAFYTWIQAEFAKGPNKGNSIPWVPQNKLDLTLDLFLTDALTLRTHVGYTGSMYALGDNANTGDDKQSGYTLVDLLLQYTFTQRRYDATLFAGIDNLFATKYNHLVTNYGWGEGYYPAPERTFKAGLSVTF